MGKMLLGIAGGIAASLIATPAMAGIDEPFVGIPGAKATVGTLGGAQPGFVVGPGHFGFGGHHDGRFGRHGGSGGSGGVWVNGGEWARYNNPAFQSDSYNDWWHDRPDRAYPAWMRNNQRCEKLWYSGSTLRC